MTVKVVEAQLGDVARFRPAGRVCGGCTKCCHVMPVEELKKPRFRWCQHAEKGKGCAIYSDRPPSCREWVCAWLISDAMNDELRPDRCHVVINPVVEPHPTRLTDAIDGRVHEFDTLTVWVDPNFPDAYRREPVRSVLDRFMQHDLCLCIRRGLDATLVFSGPAAARLGAPPDVWHEMEGHSVQDGEWTAETLWEKEALGL